MKRFAVATILGMGLILGGCGPNHPSEDEAKAAIQDAFNQEAELYKDRPAYTARGGEAEVGRKILSAEFMHDCADGPELDTADCPVIMNIQIQDGRKFTSRALIRFTIIDDQWRMLRILKEGYKPPKK